MNAGAAAPSDDLADRIQRAEQAVIARDARVAEQVGALTGRLREYVEPKRWLAPAGGAAAAAAALFLLLRNRGGTARAQAAAGSGSTGPHAGSHGGWIVHLLPTLWPLVPAKWRSRISPTTATTLFSLGMPVVEQLLRRPAARPLPTVPQVDLARYAGSWWEIARLPEPFESTCYGQPRASYRVEPDGSVGVLNRCPKKDGSERSARGTAKVVAGSGNAKLKVTFLPSWLQWLPFGWASYWILELDDGYDWALVGNPGRQFLWVLARSRTLPNSQLQALLNRAHDLGFDTSKIRISQPG